MKKIVQLILPSILLCAMLIYSCQKFGKDVYPNKQDSSFSIKNARRWYYNVFKKDPTFLKINKNSLYNYWRSASEPPKKYPIWGGAISEKVGHFDIIEMPLQVIKKAVGVPSYRQKLTSEEGKRIAQFSTERVGFIKNIATGKISKRIVQYIPDLNYLKQKNFSISQNTLTQISSDFTGWVTVRDWSDKVLGMYKFEAGRRIGHIRTILKPINPAAHTECVTVQIPIYYLTCVVAAPVDNPGDIPDCEEWGETFSHYESETQCFEVDDNPCPGLTDEECFCQLYNICNSDPDPGDPDPDDPNTCNYSDETAASLAESLISSGEGSYDYTYEGATPEYTDPESGITKRNDIVEWTFYHATFPLALGGGHLEYTAFFDAVYFKSGTTWLWDKLTYKTFSQTSGAVPPCTIMEANVISTAINLTNNLQTANVKLSYAIVGKVQGSSWQVGSQSGTLTNNFPVKIPNP